MKRFIAFLSFLFLLPAAGVKAQNLVPNPSFEGHNACPSSIGGISYSNTYTLFPTVQSWVLPTNGTADYYNSCSSAPQTSVPVNFFGHQIPHSGNAYVGGYTYVYSLPGPITAFDTREYVECQLTQALQSGHQYHVQFYCSPAEGTTSNNTAGIDKMGAVLTVSQISTPSVNYLSMTPSISSPAGIPITDTNAWTKVHGIYTATGGEQWLTLGHFYDGAPVAYSVIKPSASTIVLSYYYMDDVSIRDAASPDSTNVYDSVYCTGTGPHILHAHAGCNEYSWNTGDTSFALQIFNPGTYWVRSWSDTGYFTDTFHVAFGSTTPLHLPNDTAICSGAPFTIYPDHPYLYYFWSTGVAAPSITVTTGGQYILTTIDSCGVQKDTINVFYSPKLQLPPDTAICSGATVLLKANHTYTSYLWSTGSTASSVTVSAAGQYILSVQDVCGLQKDTVNVTLRPPVPPPLVHDTSICQFIVNPKLQVAGDSVQWFNPGSGAFTQPVVNTAATGPQVFYVTQTQGGCRSAEEPIHITIIGKPVIILPADTTLCDSNAIKLGPTAPGGVVSYAWNTGEHYSPLIVRRTGYYQLTGTNACGSSSDDILVTFHDCDSTHNTGYGLRDSCLFIPTAFTPNADSRNDRFRVVPLCSVSEYHIQIMNRWGSVVYESNDITDSWDGSFGSGPAQAGVYFYFIRFLPAHTGIVREVIKGDVTLIR